MADGNSKKAAMSLFRLRAWWALSVVLTFVAFASSRGDEQAVQRAIDRGVAYLRETQKADGRWGYNGQGVARPGGGDAGATAIAALTLLECGAPRDDQAVQKAAKYLRTACTDVTFTYSVSACLMFFDRLGEEQDNPRIEVLTLRLLGGQSVDGSWGYVCPSVGEEEVRQLRRILDKQGAAKTAPNPPEQKALANQQQGQRQLPTGDQDVRRLPGARGVRGFVPTAGDHSNMQFATFALWIGRRRGLPVRNALAAVEANCRSTQAEDGSWNYRSAFGNEVNPSMTCAGLIGLAVAYGLANEIALHHKKPVLQEGNDDPWVRRGLVALGSILDSAIALPRPSVAGAPAPAASRVAHKSQNYFLWSLERVAVAYGLETIGNRDWYALGSELLVATQEPSGSWDNDFTGNAVESSFALLFLRQANLARDLSATLKGTFRDPGKVSLRAEGLRDQSRRSEGKVAAAKSTDLSASERFKRGVLFENAGNGPDSNESMSPEAKQLCSQFLEASGEKRQAFLQKLRDTRGAPNTEALALAIPQLHGKAKTETRDALAERLNRMTSETLREKCRDPNPEIRRAAALACAMKEEKRFVPDLIDLLEDRESNVARAAAVALQSISKQDFGPALYADPAERAQARAKWQQWWKGQSNSAGKK